MTLLLKTFKTDSLPSVALAFAFLKTPLTTMCALKELLKHE